MLAVLTFTPKYFQVSLEEKGILLTAVPIITSKKFNIDTISIIPYSNFSICFFFYSCLFQNPRSHIQLVVIFH